MTLGQLRARLDSFEAGDWFSLYDDEIGWNSSKRRPCMLIESWASHPVSSIRPRSASSREGKSHAAHPYRHQPRCEIDKPGRLPLLQLRVSTALICKSNFRCSEPNREFLNSILPEHLK